MQEEMKSDEIESTKDIEQENLAGFQIQKHLAMLGVPNVQITLTPKHRKPIYDLELRVNEMWTGVIEVRSVERFHTEYAGFGGKLKGFLLEHNKLRNLRKQFYHRSEITGKGFWSKECLICWRCIHDDTCWVINLQEIVHRWDDLEPAPAEYFRSNHGEEPSSNKHLGYFIPIEWTEMIR